MIEDLILIILGASISSTYFIWLDYRAKKKFKKQERLNQIFDKKNNQIKYTFKQAREELQKYE